MGKLGNCDDKVVNCELLKLLNYLVITFQSPKRAEMEPPELALKQTVVPESLTLRNIIVVCYFIKHSHKPSLTYVLWYIYIYKKKNRVQ